MKCWAGLLTSWNKDCHEKYQQPYADDTNLMSETEEESEKAGLKLNVKQTKMTSGPITSWQIEGEKWKQ